MSLIRFEFPKNLLADGGIAFEQSDLIFHKLEQIRSGWGSTKVAPDFFTWPEQLHGAYQSQREASALGRVFKIANGMQDEIDAVVVVGSAMALASIRALVHACCDPLHNELNRAQRGSKPRIYFAGDSLDNDTLSSLLQRLNTSADGSIPSRWAVIAISDDGADQTQAIILSHLLDALASKLDADTSDLLGRYFIPFTRPGSWLHRLATSVECQELFEVELDAADRCGALALANQLPAAFLGLDCMRWLGGAFEMNQHFMAAPFDRNAVLQLIAANRLFANGLSQQSLSPTIWSDALESWGHWCESRMPISVSMRTRPRDMALQFNVMVESSRTDTLTPVDRFLETQLVEDAGPDSADVIVSNRQLQQGQGVSLILPGIDTWLMGQLFQMILIGLEVDERLGAALSDD